MIHGFWHDIFQENIRSILGQRWGSLEGSSEEMRISDYQTLSKDPYKDGEWGWALPHTQMGKPSCFTHGMRNGQPWGRNIHRVLIKERTNRKAKLVWVGEGVEILQCQHWVKGMVRLKVVTIPSIKHKQSFFIRLLESDNPCWSGFNVSF